ncbi:serine hydrolase domain-containing protein [Methylocella silvestris]|nr:serine hydrolase domain-containing protein [Methylocella silvestris]
MASAWRSLVASLLIAGGASPASADNAALMTLIAQTFGKSAVDSGAAVGVGLALIAPGQAPAFFSYGYANKSANVLFGSDVSFEIGSVTKVFTTNLLGQAIYGGRLALNQPISAFPRMLGSFKPLTAKVTLAELADFTAGFPSLAPNCNEKNQPPGCLKTDRPSTSEYTAQDFLRYFQNATPQNLQPPPPSLKALPAPYFYSDFTVGLLGLILGANPNGLLSNAALKGWEALLQKQILGPLNMRDTALYPSTSSSSTALGYQQAIGAPVVVNGALSAINVVVAGAGYRSPADPPKVAISGGAGVGAQATAQVGGNGSVTGFTVVQAGQGYVSPPKVAFVPAPGFPAPSSPAKGEAVVSGGKIIGVNIVEHGAGYAAAPTVVFSGGFGGGVGRNATGTVQIANGEVAFVGIADGGDGYALPLSVVVDPGDGFTNVVPIWAPAGALHSTVQNMATFAQAALGSPGVLVPPAMAAGFKIAQTPRACTGQKPSLSKCPANILLSDLAWATIPEDKVNHVPAIVLKNGGLTGFSTQIMLMPARGLGVVVFANSNGNQVSDNKSTGEAPLIARGALYALFYQLGGGGASAPR